MKRTRSLGLLTSEKTYALAQMRGGREALGLYLMAEEWCLDRKLDGVLPPQVVTGLPGGFTQKHADVLVACGLWTRTEDAYQFADWQAHHQAANQKANTAAKTAERVRKHREKRAAEALVASGVVRLPVGRGNGVTSALPERSARAPARTLNSLSSSPPSSETKRECEPVESGPKKLRKTRAKTPADLVHERIAALFNQRFEPRYGFADTVNDYRAMRRAVPKFMRGDALDETAVLGAVDAFLADRWWAAAGHTLDGLLRNATKYLTLSRAGGGQTQTSLADFAEMR